MSTTIRDVASFYGDFEHHPGDRKRLFAALATALDVTTVLYPGSYVDIAPSFTFDDVTYVDTDRRANAFFAHRQAVQDLIRTNRAQNGRFSLDFIHADYRHGLPIPDDKVDLLISLYAGFVSEHCTRYVRPGGWLLANNSHGDASMASLDPALELYGVLDSRSGGYRVSDRNLETYLHPKKAGLDLSADFLHSTGRGIAYTKSPYAYVFHKRSAPSTQKMAR